MTPIFAVVGHPNKGKSSIVATLARDDSVAISAESGTTRENQHLDVRVGDSHYMLVDTPGFQRPTRVLNWLQEHATTAEKRQQAEERRARIQSIQWDQSQEGGLWSRGSLMGCLVIPRRGA